MKPTDAERDTAFDCLIARGLEQGTDASGRACPDADLLAAWFDRSLSPAEADRVESHAASCALCQQILGDLARSEPDIVRAAPAPAPGAARPWHWHWRWLVPVATAATVVVVVGGRTLWAPSTTTSLPSPSTPSLAAKQEAVEPPAHASPGLPPSERVAPLPEPTRPSVQPVAPAPPKGAPARKEAISAAPEAVPMLAQAPTSTESGASGAVGGAGVLAPQSASFGKAAPGAAARNAVVRKADASGNPPGAGGGAVGSPSAYRGSAAESIAVVEALPSAPPPPAPAPAASTDRAVPRIASAVSGVSLISVSPSGRTTWRLRQAGLVDRSTDGGRTWRSHPSGVNAPLSAISAATDTACWAVGPAGLVLRTTDGVAWQRVTPPSGLDLVAVETASAVSATVTAADRSAYRTTDGGASWTKLR